ncbi:MAG: GAF domain-containing protein [Anaerolineae bacterium]|nr:GAF domain-containing protein [Anaerolineae bacterium]
MTTAEAGLGEQFSPLVERMERGELPECGRRALGPLAQGQRALKQLGVVVIEDPLSTCADCPLAANYAARGALAVRLEHGGTVYGLLTVSLPRDLVDDEEEQSLFQEVAGDIAFGLHSMEMEEERKRADKALKEYSERLEEMVEQRTKELQDARSNWCAGKSWSCWANWPVAWATSCATPWV